MPSDNIPYYVLHSKMSSKWSWGVESPCRLTKKAVVSNMEITLPVILRLCDALIGIVIRHYWLSNIYSKLIFYLISPQRDYLGGAGWILLLKHYRSLFSISRVIPRHGLYRPAFLTYSCHHTGGFSSSLFPHRHLKLGETFYSTYLSDSLNWPVKNWPLSPSQGPCRRCTGCRQNVCTYFQISFR